MGDDVTRASDTPYGPHTSQCAQGLVVPCRLEGVVGHRESEGGI